jgi:hypothetical protein
MMGLHLSIRLAAGVLAESGERRDHTMDLKSLPTLRFHPLPIDIRNIRFQQRRIIKLRHIMSHGVCILPRNIWQSRSLKS